MQLEAAKGREVSRRKICGYSTAVQSIELPFRRIRERSDQLLGSLIAVLSDDGSPETKLAGHGNGRLELIADVRDQEHGRPKPGVRWQGGLQEYDFPAWNHRDIDGGAVGCISHVSAAAHLDVGIDTVREVSPRIAVVRGVRVHGRVRRKQRHYCATVGILADDADGEWNANRDRCWRGSNNAAAGFDHSKIRDDAVERRTRNVTSSVAHSLPVEESPLDGDQLGHESADDRKDHETNQELNECEAATSAAQI